MNWLTKWFGPAPEPPAPQPDHGGTSAFKVGDQLLCVKGDPRMGLTAGEYYLVPFMPGEKFVPVYNDFGVLSFCHPDKFAI